MMCVGCADVTGVPSQLDGSEPGGMPESEESEKVKGKSGPGEFNTGF